MEWQCFLNSFFSHKYKKRMFQNIELQLCPWLRPETSVTDNSNLRVLPLYLSPNLFGNLAHEVELSPLLLFGELIANLARCKAALRT